MKKPFLLASLSIALIASLLFTFVTPAVAQEQTRISISPVTFNLTANPGDTLEQVFKVRNDSAFAQAITVEAQNFVAVGEEGQVGFADEDSSFDLASWIQIDNDNFTLESGEEVQVPYLIRVPGNAEPGGHYASVYAYTGAPSPGSGSGSSVAQRIGSLVLLRVAGDVKEEASIESFATGDFTAGEQVPFNLRVKNQGTVHIRPRGFVTITDILGNKVDEISVEELNVFPGAIRRIGATWESPSFIGRFTANALLQYGDTNQQVVATTTFWIIPWKTVGIAAAVFVVTILILWFGRRRIGRSIKALVSGK